MFKVKGNLLRHHQINHSANLTKYGITYNHLYQIMAGVKARLPQEYAYARKQQGMQKSSRRYIEEMLALRISACAGDIMYVMLLLHCGVDPNSRDSQGSVPLWEAMVGKHEKVIKLLIDNGANLFSGDMCRFACTAARNDDLDLLKEMVLYGADITLPQANGVTAVHIAGCKQNEEIVQFLLDQGADPLHGQNASEYIVNKITEGVARFHKKFPGLSYENKTSHEGTLVEKHVCAECRKPPPYSIGALNVQNRGECSTRVTISCQHSSNGPKLVRLPQSLEELLQLSTSKFGIISTKVLTADRAEIEDISLIRDGDHLILASDSYCSESNNQCFGHWG